MPHGKSLTKEDNPAPKRNKPEAPKEAVRTDVKKNPGGTMSYGPKGGGY